MEPLTMALLAGGGANVLSSVLGGFGATQAGREKRKAINSAMGTVNQGYSDALGYQEPFYGAGVNALNASSALAGNDIPEYNGYNEPLNIDKFLDPAMQFEIEQSNNALAGSFLGQGTSKSGMAMRALQGNAQNIARQNFQQATQNAMADRGFDYNAKMQEIGLRRQAREQKMAELMNLAQMGQGAGNNMSTLQTQKAGNIANLQMGKGDINAQMSALPYQIGGNILQQGGKLATNYFGGMTPSPSAFNAGGTGGGVPMGAIDLRGGMA